MDSLEDGANITDVGGGGKSETTDKTSAHVRDNVSVQVGHDENHGLVDRRIGDHLRI